MKMFMKRKVALFMVAMLLVPVFWNQNTTVARAATPTFIKSKVELVGVGVTYQLGIKNKVSKSKYAWSTTNKTIAKVTKNGLVTSVGGGTANIKCKITYPSKKTKTLSCKVTVTIPPTPTLVNDIVELAGSGETYQLEIKDEVANSKYVWSTTNESIATVTSSGLITSVGSGTANINCKITYPSKKSKTLSCKVTVTIPATEISITNAAVVNNAYQMSVGSTADLDTVLTPANSTDKTYWVIDGEYGDSGCIRIDDAETGKITALKAGKVALNVKAVKTATKADYDLSIISAGIIIDVLVPSFKVNSVDILSSNQITVVFDNPAQKSTVIGTDGKLLNNIDIKAIPDTKNVLAKDPGTLTPKLSDDGKTLTITSANQLEGTYRISFTSSILSTSGIALEDYNKNINYIDNIPPFIVGSPTIDDIGTTCTIQFSEPINTGFKVSNAQLASGSTMTEYTRSILNTTGSYILSADKKSLSINLTNISPTDYNKAFNVTISHVEDLAGNVSGAYLIATLFTDKNPQPQAQLINIERTSYYFLTATYSRAISFGGILQIENGTQFTGVVDTSNTRKVNYRINETEARYTGAKAVSIRDWNSFNVIPTDLTARTPQTRSVNFDVDKVPPVLTNYVFDTATGILTLTYSENVNLMSVVNAFTARINTQTQDVQNININYTMVPHTLGNNIIKLKISNMQFIGYYSFVINQAFVTDNFMNQSTAANVTINNMNGGGGTELPGPYMITQSTTNASQINLMFLNKLDLATAQNVSNYSITGVTIIKAEVISNDSVSGAIVVLTVMEGSIDVTVDRQLKISGVMGYNGGYTAITAFSQWVSLKDNKKPSYINSVFDTNSKSAVHLNFNEAMQGSLIVNASLMVNGSTTWVSLGNPIVTINGNVVNVQLSQIIPSGSYIKLEVIANNLTDTSGNAVTFNPTTIGTPVSY